MLNSFICGLNLLTTENVFFGVSALFLSCWKSAFKYIDVYISVSFNLKMILKGSAFEVIKDTF